MNAQEKIIGFLYGTRLGRILTKLLIRPRVSETAGRLLNLPVSACLIPGFIKRNKIDMSQYEQKKYSSFNEFFTRRIIEGKRPICMDEDALIAPCDARLTVYGIDDESRFFIKGREYSMHELFKSRKIEDYYQGGYLLLYRLTVDDYHRFCYIDEGRKSRNYSIPGVFHTVNPAANEKYPVYKENSREFSFLKSRNFGTIAMMEVGAMMVGKIVNNHQEGYVHRGEEKGRFEFGGSTVIICLKKDAAVISDEILQNSSNGIETIVRMGQAVGQKKLKN